MSDLSKSIYDLETKFESVGIKKETFLKEASFAVQAIEKNTYLASCPKNSILVAVYNLALTGLTLNPALAYAYLVPRKLKKTDKSPQCVLDISYKGFVKIAMDSGGIKRITANVIHENDQFEAQEGYEPFIIHKPVYFNDRGAMLGAYVVATLPDESKVHCIMGKKEIEKVKAVSQMGGSGPWMQWAGEMWVKTVIKRARKLWPHSEKLAIAVQISNDSEGFRQIENKGETKKIQQMAASSLCLDVEETQRIHYENQHDHSNIITATITIWDIEGDSESRISKEKVTDVKIVLLENGINVDEMLGKMKIKSMSEVKGKDLEKIKEYMDGA